MGKIISHVVHRLITESTYKFKWISQCFVYLELIVNLTLNSLTTFLPLRQNIHKIHRNQLLGNAIDPPKKNILTLHKIYPEKEFLLSLHTKSNLIYANVLTLTINYCLYVLPVCTVLYILLKMVGFQQCYVKAGFFFVKLNY